MKAGILRSFIWLFSAALLVLSPMARAAVINVSVVNYEFSPKNFTCVLGDTVQWNWQQGDHTTTSVMLPPGAASWDHIMDVNNPTFRYKVTTAGTYSYKCTPHASMNMVGGFVANATGISATQVPKLAFSIYPLPVKDIATIGLSTTINAKAYVSVYNLAGQEVGARDLDLYPGNNEFALDLSRLKSGLYFVELRSPGLNPYTVRILKQ
jgi:plastocyanin